MIINFIIKSKKQSLVAVGLVFDSFSYLINKLVTINSKIIKITCIDGGKYILKSGIYNFSMPVLLLRN